jgi:hypothetical protein
MSSQIGDRIISVGKPHNSRSKINLFKGSLDKPDVCGIVFDQ